MQKKPSHLLNINLARQKNKKKILKKFLKIVLFFFVISVSIIGFWLKIIKPRFFEEVCLNSFPINVCENVVSLHKTKTGFCVCGEKNLNFYNKNGEIESSNVHNFINPVCCGVDDLFLLFDQTANGCCLFDFKTSHFKTLLDDEIVFAKIAKNGNCAFVVKSSEGLANLIVLNKLGQQIFKWCSTNDLIIDLDFVNDGTDCVVCLFGVNLDGFEKTTLLKLNFKNNVLKIKQTFDEIMPIAIKKTNTGVVLLCDDCFLILDNNFSNVRTLKFFDSLKNFCLSNQNYFVFYFANCVYSYDKFANLLGEMNLNENIKKIEINENHILLLTENGIFICNLNLKILKKISFSKIVNDFFVCDNFCYVLCGEKLEKLRIF